MNRVNRWRLVGYSLAGALVMTLLTRLFPLRSLLGATRYGFPLAWLVRRVLAPQYVPWRVQWLGLVVDVVVWTGIIVVLVLYGQFDHRSTGGQPTPVANGEADRVGSAAALRHH